MIHSIMVVKIDLHPYRKPHQLVASPTLLQPQLSTSKSILEPKSTFRPESDHSLSYQLGKAFSHSVSRGLPTGIQQTRIFHLLKGDIRPENRSFMFPFLSQISFPSIFLLRPAFSATANAQHIADQVLLQSSPSISYANFFYGRVSNRFLFFFLSIRCMHCCFISVRLDLRPFSDRLLLS